MQGFLLPRWETIQEFERFVRGRPVQSLESSCTVFGWLEGCTRLPPCQGEPRGALEEGLSRWPGCIGSERDRAMESTITQVHVPTDLARRYEALAQQTGESREAVIAEVLQAYLDQVEADDARLEESIAAADRGEVVAAEVVAAESEAFLGQLGIRPEQRAAIHAEVVAEMEAAYGVSL